MNEVKITKLQFRDTYFLPTVCVYILLGFIQHALPVFAWRLSIALGAVGVWTRADCLVIVKICRVLHDDTSCVHVSTKKKTAAVCGITRALGVCVCVFKEAFC